MRQWWRKASKERQKVSEENKRRLEKREKLAANEEREDFLLL